MSHHKAYPVYKDSRVEWLGKVPEHWSTVPFKWLAVIQNGKDYKEVETSEGGFPVIGSGGEFARASQYLFNGESVLLGRKGTIDRPLHIDGPFWTVDTMFYTVIGPKVVGKYLYYCTLTIQFDRYSTNTALPSMTQEVLGQIPFAVPGIQEQRIISAHLDRETTRIDSLVSKKTRFIELLREKRQTLITHAVTKGLDPDVRMKDSGVEWLGEVPEHWIAQDLRYLADKIVDGAHFTPTYVDDGVPFLRVTDITARSIELDNLKRIPESEHQELSRRCKPVRGDLLLSKNGTIGVPRVITWDWEFSIFVSLCLIKANSRLNVFFASYVFLSKSIEAQINDGSKQSSVINLHLEEIAAFKFPVPPLSEQLEIVRFLDRETARLDTLITKTERSIELLKERRTAVITAAVTGQIDLREAA